MKVKIVAMVCGLAWAPVWAGTTADSLAAEYSRLLRSGGEVTTKIRSAERSSGTCDISSCSASRVPPSMAEVKDDSLCGVITESNMLKCFEGKKVDTGWVEVFTFEDAQRSVGGAHHHIKAIRVRLSVRDGRVTLQAWERRWFYNGTVSAIRAIEDTAISVKGALAKNLIDSSGVRYNYIQSRTEATCDGLSVGTLTIDVWLPWGSVDNPDARQVTKTRSGTGVAQCVASCFPAGALVLMADGSMRAIERIVVGDTLMGANGAPVVVQEVEQPILGNRRMMAMEDGSLYWSEEHAFWTRDLSGRQWWWAANPDRWRWEASIGHIGGLRDNATLRGGDGFAFAHLDGWRDVAVHEAECYGPETQLYLPRTNGVPIIVNGYVVGAGVNQKAFEYEDFDWNVCRHIVLEECFAEAV